MMETASVWWIGRGMGGTKLGVVVLGGGDIRNACRVLWVVNAVS